MKIRKLLSVGLVSSMVASMALTGCGDNKNDSGKEESKGSVYYLNFKPEADKAWQALATEYKNETGVDVKVVTAANNKYEETLTAEIDGDTPPTLSDL